MAMYSSLHTLSVSFETKFKYHDTQHNHNQHINTQLKDTLYNHNQHIDTQLNGTQYNNTQHNNKNTTLSIMVLSTTMFIL